ncbi:hypothetical protein EYF80_057852 [Liparis tanakae]|uniref:Uncharacterized protein n=1 Tax=Liparis tanakae TaxID=230148 RepID=A0A4Z2ETM2_9TELE|nr:hypothetical protein EYF80_057852 [Liparis tanakae]
MEPERSRDTDSSRDTRDSRGTWKRLALTSGRRAPFTSRHVPACRAAARIREFRRGGGAGRGYRRELPVVLVTVVQSLTSRAESLPMRPAGDVSPAAELRADWFTPSRERHPAPPPPYTSAVVMSVNMERWLPLLPSGPMGEDGTDSFPTSQNGPVVFLSTTFVS